MAATVRPRCPSPACRACRWATFHFLTCQRNDTRPPSAHASQLRTQARPRPVSRACPPDKREPAPPPPRRTAPSTFPSRRRRRRRAGLGLARGPCQTLGAARVARDRSWSAAPAAVLLTREAPRRAAGTGREAAADGRRDKPGIPPLACERRTRRNLSGEPGVCEPAARWTCVREARRWRGPLSKSSQPPAESAEPPAADMEVEVAPRQRMATSSRSKVRVALGPMPACPRRVTCACPKQHAAPGALCRTGQPRVTAGSA